ncbi:MAG: DNA repair protein RadC [bacterium]|nr:DNA repair protein RadC [bacterium]
MKIKDLPDLEKPRERLNKYGAKYLSNEELLAILLRTGSKDKNVKELSSTVLTKLKTIEDMDKMTINELSSIKGIGKVKAITLLAAIELGKRVNTKSFNENITLNNAALINEYFSNYITGDKEKLLVILLDNKKRLISYQIMYEGTSEEVSASPKEIFNYAIKERAASIILMHNHPSGVITPSSADNSITKNLALSGQMLGINILDHIITNGKEFFSFYEEMNKNEA